DGFPAAAGFTCATFRKIFAGPLGAGPRPPPPLPPRRNVKWCFAWTRRDASENTNGLSSPAPPAATSPRANSQLGHVVRYFCSSVEAAPPASALALRSAVGTGSLWKRATTSDDGNPRLGSLTTDAICCANSAVIPSRAANSFNVILGSPSAARCLKYQFA